MHKFTKLVPSPIRRAIRRQIQSLKQPRMVWGYQDASGSFRAATRISDTAILYHPENISMGENVFVWHYTILDGTGGLEIEEGAQIGAWVGLFTHSSHISIRLLGKHYQEIPEYEKPGYVTAPVRIGRYVFIGAAAKVLPGVSVGNGALISAGSMVIKDVPPFSIMRGSPAKEVGDTRELDESYLCDERLRKWYQEWQE